MLNNCQCKEQEKKFLRHTFGLGIYIYIYNTALEKENQTVMECDVTEET